MEPVLVGWQRYLERLRACGQLDSVALREWEAETPLGADRPTDSRRDRPILGDDLQDRLKASRDLLEVATPQLEWLSIFLGSIPHGVALADADAVVLRTWGDADLMASLHLASGSLRSERAVGPSGLGSSLAVNQPVVLVGASDAPDAAQRFTRIGVPIHHGDGRVVGALELCSAAASAQPEWVVLIGHVARVIERELVWHLRERGDETPRLAVAATVVPSARPRMPSPADEAAWAREVGQSQEREQQLQRVIDAAPVGLVMIDPEGSIRVANARLCEIFGYEQDELLGSPIEALVPGPLRERHLRNWDAYAAAPEPREMAFAQALSGRKKDGSEIPVEVGLQPLSLNNREFILAAVSEVSGHRKVEEQLRASEEMATAILNAITAQIAVVNRSGTIVAVNAAWKRFAFESQGSAPVGVGVGADYLEICRRAVGEERDQAEKVGVGLQEVLNGTLPEFSIEYPCHSATEQRWFLLHAVPLAADHGGAVISHTPITQLKQAEEALQRAHDLLEQRVAERTTQLATLNETLQREVEVRRIAEAELRESEERYRAVVQDQTEVVSRFRADGTFTFVNDIYCRTFGKTPDELIGQRWVPVAHPDDVTSIVAELATLSPERPVVRIENRVLDGEGKTRWMEFVNRGFFQPDGELIEVQSVGRDVSERVRAQEHLRTSEERMRLAMDAAQINSWDWDIQLNTVIWSDQFEPTTGMGHGIVGGTLDSFLAVVHEDDRSRVNAALREALEQHQLFNAEFRLVRPDATVRWVASKGRVYYDTQDRPVRMVGVELDITERKRSEAALRAALHERETLLREVHHRVKNNLQVIDSLLYLQSQYVQDRPSVEKFRECQRRVRSMALVHERLYRAPDLARVDFSEYIECLSRDLFRAYQVDTERIQLECDVHGVSLSLEAAVPCGLLVNELISNCLKHAFRGRAHGRIRVSITPSAAEEATLSVSDDGVGLPADFDPSGADSFGMTLILALVGQLHGELEIDRRVGTSMRVNFRCTT